MKELLFKEIIKTNNNNLVDKHLNLKSETLQNIRNLKDVCKLEHNINLTYSDVANISLILFFNLIKEMNHKFNETETVIIFKQMLINYSKDTELLKDTKLILDISKE